MSANDKEWFVNYEFEDEAIAHAKKRAEEPDRAPLLEGVTIDDTCYTGTNGRLGKIPDTCYSFWVGGSLEVKLSLCCVSVNEMSLTKSRCLVMVT